MPCARNSSSSAARDNARKNHLENCTFIAGDVLKKLDEIEERPDFIVRARAVDMFPGTAHVETVVQLSK
jgi:tRNA/tmRNA/rRNA uracil-C5-methylase (TrmA/RlmC/RlmD family)